MSDFFDAFKGAGGGPTEPGHWRNYEKFGRLTGTGEVDGEIELPEGEVLVCSDGNDEIEELEVTLTGPDGNPVELERFGRDHIDSERGAQNLFWVGKGELITPGIHRLLVRAPSPEEPLIIVAGQPLSAKEMMLGAFTGKGPFKRPG